jgi:hypothetical protein
MNRKYTICLLVVFSLCGIYYFRYPLFGLYNSIFHREEVDVIEKYIKVLVYGTDNEVISISTSDSTTIKPIVLGGIRKLKNIVDVNDVTILYLYSRNDEGRIILDVKGYFGNPDATFMSQLVKTPSGKWYVRMFGVSSHYFQDKLGVH